MLVHLWEIFCEKDTQNVKNNIVEGYYFKDSISLEFIKKKHALELSNISNLVDFSTRMNIFRKINIFVEIQLR